MTTFTAETRLLAHPRLADSLTRAHSHDLVPITLRSRRSRAVMPTQRDELATQRHLPGLSLAVLELARNVTLQSVTGAATHGSGPGRSRTVTSEGAVSSVTERSRNVAVTQRDRAEQDQHHGPRSSRPKLIIGPSKINTKMILIPLGVPRHRFAVTADATPPGTQ